MAIMLASDVLVELLEEKIDNLDESIKSTKEVIEILKISKDKIKSQYHSIQFKIEQYNDLLEILFLLNDKLDLNLYVDSKNLTYYLITNGNKIEIPENEYIKLKYVFDRMQLIKIIENKGDEN